MLTKPTRYRNVWRVKNIKSNLYLNDFLKNYDILGDTLRGWFLGDGAAKLSKSVDSLSPSHGEYHETKPLLLYFMVDFPNLIIIFPLSLSRRPRDLYWYHF